MKLGKEVGLGPGHIVLHEDPSPPKKGAQQPTHFLAHVYCGQTAGWIKIPLGMKVGVGPGDIVLDGVLAPPKKGNSSPTFRPMAVVAKQLDGSRCHLVRK